MNYPILLVIIIILIVIFRYNLQKSDKSRAKQNEDFWKKEESSLFARAKEIDKDLFINTNLPKSLKKTELEYEKLGNKKLYELQERCFSLSDNFLLNLSHMTNIEIRQTFGAAKLDTVEKYEINYALYIKSLYQFGKDLFDIGLVDDAIKVLEEGINVGTDISNHYILLGKIYYNKNEKSKISMLYDKANLLNSLTKNKILKELSKLLNSN